MQPRACCKTRKKNCTSAHHYAPAIACNTIATNFTSLLNSTTTNVSAALPDRSLQTSTIHPSIIKRPTGCLDPRFHKQVVIQNRGGDSIASRIPNKLLDMKSSQSDYRRDTVVDSSLPSIERADADPECSCLWKRSDAHNSKSLVCNHHATLIHENHQQDKSTTLNHGDDNVAIMSAITSPALISPRGNSINSRDSRPGKNMASLASPLLPLSPLPPLANDYDEIQTINLENHNNACKHTLLDDEIFSKKFHASKNLHRSISLSNLAIGSRESHEIHYDNTLENIESQSKYQMNQNQSIGAYENRSNYMYPTQKREYDNLKLASRPPSTSRNIPIKRQRLMDENGLEYYYKTDDDNFRKSQDSLSSSASNDELYRSNASGIEDQRFNQDMSLSSLNNKSVFSNQTTVDVITVVKKELDTKINNDDDDDDENGHEDENDSNYNRDSITLPHIAKVVVLIVGILHLMFVIGQPITELLLTKNQFQHHSNHVSNNFLEFLFDNYLVASFRAAFAQMYQFVDEFVLQSVHACSKCN